MRAGRAAIATTAGALAILTGLPLLAAGTGATSEPPLASWAAAELPTRVLQAYRNAAAHCGGLRWELLAAIGWVESRHGTAGGATAAEHTGVVSPPIYGPPLDGSDGVRAVPAGPWAGEWGLTGEWQRALGPMQFLPGTFAAYATDGDGDGVTDPHDIDDATATAAAFLCNGAPDIGDERAALLRYNRSESYVDEVLAYADRLEHPPALLCPIAGAVSFTDTWGAPRSGGRRHRGVDMFARRGTPVVAPVAGEVELASNDLGGLVFRLWADDGTYYYGAHLDRHSTAAGLVDAGTVLGYVGTTGNAVGTPPHLHFEIHRPGPGPGTTAVNPTAAVADACGLSRSPVAVTGGD